jgi:hypothetical protein
MSYNNENQLFLAMAQGGQLTPEMMQMMQQSGQLPQLNMGASLNDIQKMNMKQQSHYGNGNAMFRYGGIPYKADGGEQQENLDQSFLSPEKKYSGRVQDFLKQLKSKAMSAVQDEMVNTANDYDQEAMAIDMRNQMRYGGVYAPGGTTFGQQPMLDTSGVNTANAWLKAGQDNQVDMTKNLGTLAGAATGLQGFFSNSGTDAFNNNIYNTNPIVKSTITDLETGKRERIRMAPGGQPDITPIRNMTPEQFAENAQLEANAKAMGWINPDGTADVAGYSAVGKDGKQYGYGPQYKAKLATTTKAKTKKEETPKLTPEQEAAAKVKAEQEARIAEETKKAEEDKKKKEESKTEDKTEDKKTEETKTAGKKTTDVGDGMDVWRALADPNSTQAGAYYQLDKKGNKIPMAFYDPNMRITSSSAEYRAPLGNLFRSKENDRSGVMKRSTYTFGTLDSPTQVPDIQLGPNAQVPAPAASGPTWANQFFPQQKEQLQGPGYAGGPWSVELQGGLSDAAGWARNPELDEMHRQEFANWRPGMQIPNGPPSMGLKVGPGNFTPGAQPVQQQSVPLPGPLTAKQARQQGRQQVADAKTQAAIDKINAANQQGSQPVQMMTPQGSMNPYNQTLNLMNGVSAGVIQPGVYTDPNIINAQNAAANAAWFTLPPSGAKRYGGEGLRRFVPGGPTTDLNDAGMGMDNAIGFNSGNTTGWNNFSAPAPGPTYGNGPLDKPMTIGKIYQEPGITNEKQIDNKHRKQNPFLVPGIMAGLDVLGGAAAFADANKMTKEAMGKFSADQTYAVLPEKSGSKGDYDPTGMLRPNDYVPTQFQGYNFQSNYAARGGEMSEGDEMYLDEDTINAILAAGGEIEYLD